jgi:hypothetical protein
MSVTELLLTVRDTLRTNCSLATAECKVMQNAKPTPTCGTRFVSVFPTRMTRLAPSGNCKLYSCQFSIALTYRVSALPNDALGESLLALATTAGMLNFFESLVNAIDLNGAIVTGANTYGTSATRVVEIPVLNDGDLFSVQLADGSWFQAELEEQVGLVMEARFTTTIVLA